MSIRLKLTIGLMIIILISNIILGLITSIYIKRVYIEEVQARVSIYLKSARDIYNDKMDEVEQVLQAISYRRGMVTPLEEEVEGDMGNVLNRVYEDSKLDILILVGPDGRVVYRAHNPAKHGDDLSGLPVIEQSLASWKNTRGTMVFSHDFLRNEGVELADRAVIEIQETPRAMPKSEIIERRGLFMAACVPFVSLDDENNEIYLGVLLGGCLLNNNFDIVDKIKSQLFQGQLYKNKDIGTATIFFDDLRISTNVMNASGQRAVGSCMSAEVYNRVILEGEIWDDRAFVVNNWYITAYEPIRDLNSKIIGSLYVGLLEEPFKRPQKMIIMFFMLMINISVIAGLILIIVYTRYLLKPIDTIVNMSRKVIKGDLKARSGISPPGEMGVLCESIDRMAEAIENRENELQRITRQQITQSEKLASIGRLSAGIAHEINNPLTGILTFAHMLRQKQNAVPENLEDIEVIIRETKRIQDIVKGLLDFARQTPSTEIYIDINNIIHQTLNLIKSQKEFRKITMEERYEEKMPLYYGDKNQLQQVFLNIILNAAEAISGSGTITVTTQLTDNDLVIAVQDTGCGIKKENLNKIFDPFYTTKPAGKGTGLGLSISYGIIESYNGHIICESGEGSGTTFRICLPLIRNTMNHSKRHENDE